ncbi:AraC family transcriptional regulator [Bradyrhizobium septentrionale]|uniref:AraC family transcriptional regulator n=1 Tax=Bradyrhizobium septentrionale TaxID=1404411 RepID=A0A974A4M9_9BRAD|nr:helix-turn-helix domain-containing protein [Bradyrhizobium septentrionale]UGY16553.1 helix-turn-helix domain-containing protein [Bradyrhizobium septentrionale]UGY25210.1 helix-turn-helix domain-containing protein [Bradyrhizobium septentrionale]
MALTALELGLRGAVVALFLVVCAVLLLRYAAVNRAASLGAAMGAAGAAYAISTAPFFPAASFGWSSPFVAFAMGSPVIFWLWARAIFDAQFVLRPWHAAVWTLLAGLGVVSHNCWTIWPDVAGTCGRMLALATIAFAVLGVAQIPKGWRTAVTTARGRLLIALVIGVGLQMVFAAAAGLAAIPTQSISLSAALGLATFALMSIWMMLFDPPESQPAAGGGQAGRASGSFEPDGLATKDRAPQDRASLNRLNHLMTTERTYRQEGLTIGLLAARLGMPEYRLRTLINDGLGHRNFNAFLNRYRLDEAKAALADASQAEVPVLTIALDAGFQSLAPFNRAFKADTGLTPSEFRRQAAAAATADLAEIARPE